MAIAISVLVTTPAITANSESESERIAAVIKLTKDFSKGRAV